MTVRPGRPRMFVVFMESPVLPFSLPFLNSPISLILLMLESLSSGRLYIPSIPLFSNINLAFFGLFNCPFSSFELIPSSKCWEECCLLCTLCFPPFFSVLLVWKLIWIFLLCRLCLTVLLFTIIQPGGWEFWVLADPFLQKMPTLVLKWWRASRRSTVISE